MKYRIGNALEWIANLFHNLADRAYRYGEPKDDIGEGWWSMDQSFPLQKYESHITFTDDSLLLNEEMAAKIVDEALNRYQSDHPLA